MPRTHCAAEASGEKNRTLGDILKVTFGVFSVAIDICIKCFSKSNL